jgi:hypothetical protein
MVTASAGTNRILSIPHVKEMVYENRMSYAYKHGHEFMWANITSYSLPNNAPVYWNKIPVLQEAFLRFPKAEWIWWLDMDIIIMNMSLSLHDHILSPEGLARNILLDQKINKPGGNFSGYKTPATYKYEDINFIISGDYWGMNVGNFFMRRSKWSDWLLNLWIEPLYVEQNWTFPENDAWTHMWRHHNIVRDHAAYMKQRAMNGYGEYNFLGKHWEPGDHVVHFAGCGDHPNCPAHWEKYWNMREKYEVPAFIKLKLEDGTAEIENVQKGIGLPSG